MWRKTELLRKFNHFSRNSLSNVTRCFSGEVQTCFAPTRSEFQKNYYGKLPVVVKYGLNWNAFNKWSFDYFESSFNKVPANLFQFDLENNYARKQISGKKVSEALQLIRTNRSLRFKYYLIRQSIPDYFPELLSDIQFPDWCSAERLDTNLWIGEKGSCTPLHYDSTENFLIQVQGKKEVTLLPQNNRCLEITSPLTGGRFNFSQSKFIEAIDPKVLRQNSHDILSCILEQGMVLYIPVGWWHQVRTLEDSISVNYWWPSKKIDNTYKHYITDCQTTSYHNQIFPREQSKLIKECTYDNCLDTAKALNNLNDHRLAALVCGVFLEELLKAYERMYFISDKKVTNLEDIIDKLMSIDHERFYVSSAQREIWQYILNKSFKENEVLNKTFVANLIKSVDGYFNQTTLTIRKELNFQGA